METLHIYLVDGSTVTYELSASDYFFVAAQLIGPFQAYRDAYPRGHKRFENRDGELSSRYIEVPTGAESDFIPHASILRVRLKVDERFTPR
jgi:hypothetical protein